MTDYGVEVFITRSTRVFGDKAGLFLAALLDRVPGASTPDSLFATPRHAA